MGLLKKLLEEVGGATPSERTALAEALRRPEAAPTVRPELPIDERRQLGRDLKARDEAFRSRKAKLEADIDVLSTKRQEIEEQLGRLTMELGELPHAYTAFRDEAWRRLWAGRMPLAEELIERIVAEARSLTISSFDLPPDRWFGLDAAHSDVALSGRTVSNAASVRAHGAALLRLAEQVRDVVERGHVATEEELMEWYTRAYKALVPIEPLEDVLRRDVRGHKFIRQARKLVPQAFDDTRPPAA